MSVTRSFSAMLKDYMPLELLKEEMVKRDWMLSNIEIDEGWKGASSTSGEAAYIVPFVGAGASSVEFGSLAAESDISEDNFVRGRITAQKHVNATMQFHSRDLQEHDGAPNEKSFLKILPDRLEAMMSYFKEVVSINLLDGPHFATLTADGDTGGTGLMTVDRIDRFAIGQKFSIDDGNSSPQALYVTAVNVNTKVVTVSDSRGGAAFSISGYTVAQAAKCFHPGAQSASFQSLYDALLSAANGGSANLHGVSKLAYPYLQAVNVSGASITATNILEKLFDAYTEVRTRAKGNASIILMSYKHLGSIMKLIETQKGGYKVTPTTTKASEFGWTEIEITSVKGQLKLVGIQEASDSNIVFLDPKALVFATDRLFHREKSPDGNEYYVVRGTSGYKYIVDISLRGDLVVKAPGHCGIIHSISY
jgi:hypothetical protein